MRKIGLLVWIFLLCWSASNGQTISLVGQRIGDLPMQPLLQNGAANPTFTQADKGLVLVDFFATWCAPCLRALPVLEKLQAQNPELRILLVTNQEKTVIEKFLKARPGLRLPVLLDEKGVWTNRFAPPALPFSFLAKEGMVVARVEAATISAESLRMLSQSVAQQPRVETPAASPSPKTAMTSTSFSNPISANAAVALSQRYLYAAKTGASVESLAAELASFPIGMLEADLNSTDAATAFWLNVYNAYTQLTLKQHPQAYERRNKFYAARNIMVAGQALSLDQIEHGILRGNQWKLGLGYLRNPFSAEIVRRWKLAKADPRIHFALNCGAQSCPPIAFYSNEKLSQQLDLATAAYLQSEVQHKTEENVVELPKLMSWFRGDFGGKEGTMALLKKHGLIPPEAKPRLRFKPYDWKLSLNNYAQ